MFQLKDYDSRFAMFDSEVQKLKDELQTAEVNRVSLQQCLNSTEEKLRKSTDAYNTQTDAITEKDQEVKKTDRVLPRQGFSGVRHLDLN